MNYNFKTTNQPLSFGLAMLAGIGLIMMLIVLFAGAFVTEPQGNLLLFLFLGGLGFLILGVVGWVAVVQPHKHFDDINQPLDDGHGHAPSTEHAIALTDAEHSVTAADPHTAHH
ncbi:MAG: hypothetical protein IAE89_15430 [Anaerolineae bacterium]|nr:hypothetical protein [Anaerolineae bacterium]